MAALSLRHDLAFKQPREPRQRSCDGLPRVMPPRSHWLEHLYVSPGPRESVGSHVVEEKPRGGRNFLSGRPGASGGILRGIQRNTTVRLQLMGIALSRHFV